MREDKRVNQPLVVGDVIELIYMDDPYNPISPLTRGVVMGFEPTPGMDKILVRWIIDADNEEFRNMPMIPEADIWRKITPTVKENTKMKKIKLTEADLVTLVERVIKEDGHTDIPSAIRKCKLIMDDAGDIMEKLIELSETGGSLPSWWMD